MMRKDESLFDWIVVSVISQDRPGIVASVSKVLYQNHYNIEALSQTAVLGQFAMLLVASAKKGQAHQRLDTAFQALSQTMGLNISLKEPRREDMVPYHKNETEPFVITVHGEDRPGLAYGVSEILAGWEINITRLDAKVTSIGQKLEYLQIYEVDIPKELDFDLLHDKLRKRGQELGVSIDLQHREIFRAINQI
jgi:glycine cleavage system transcriptional repressor